MSQRYPRHADTVSQVRQLTTLFLVLVVGCSQSTTSTEARPAPTSTVSQPTSTRAASSTTVTSATDELAILFVGNSHTGTHGVPALVEEFLDSDPSTEARVLLITSDFLSTAANNDRLVEEIDSGRWDVVVLQGQEVSQSHTIDYSRAGAIALAQASEAAGSRPMLFSEWSRRDIDETEYIEAIYEQIADASGAEVIPIGRAWDRFLVTAPGYPLWGSDGNHSSPEGALLAAATIAYAIAGSDAVFSTDTDLAPFLDAARFTIDDFAGG